MPDDSPPLTPEADSGSWHRTLEGLTVVRQRATDAGDPAAIASADEKIRRALDLVTGQELLTEWMKTKWESGDPVMEALAAEVGRRSLDV